MQNLTNYMKHLQIMFILPVTSGHLSVLTALTSGRYRQVSRQVLLGDKCLRHFTDINLRIC